MCSEKHEHTSNSLFKYLLQQLHVHVDHVLHISSLHVESMFIIDIRKTFSAEAILFKVAGKPEIASTHY